VLGFAAWTRLPEAVRVRFGDPAAAVDYVGEFDVVRASWLGRLVAFACKLLGMPVVPRTGLFGRRANGERIKVRLPALLSPGTTHVEHFDEADGWFRFTMTVTHPFFGEMFYQTGRFRAAGEQL
jgi:Domain of unknown function (DUF4166)